MHKKQFLAEKDCLVCGRPFSWRKKWSRDWENVKYCGEKCRRNPANGKLLQANQNK